MTETPGKQPGPAGNQAGVPDLNELARRLLDLWQDQLAAVAANPDLATQAARLMAAMPLPGMWLNQMGQMGPMGAQAASHTGGPDADMTKIWAKMSQDWMAQDWWKGTQGATSENAGTGQPGAEPAAPPVPAGPPAAAAASGAGRGDLDELSRRLAGIEQRLGELAQSEKPARKRAPARPKAAARRPRATRAADPGSGSGGADGGTPG